MIGSFCQLLAFDYSLLERDDVPGDRRRVPGDKNDVPAHGPVFLEKESPRGGVNSIRILETYQQWLPTLICNRSEAIFMHDGSRTHTARRVLDWLRDKESFIMDWPAYSPDLNPIENLFALLKDKVLKMFPKIYDMPNNEETRGYLTAAAQTAWSQIDPDVLRRLSESMPRRVQAIIEAEGWYTTY